MATAPPAKPNPAAAVERAIATAAGRVRTNDLLTGAAAAAVVLLGYLAVVVTLDRLLNLPDWVRLLGLAGLLAGLGAIAYFLVVRPMRRRVNPRYVARKIEGTMPDAKNVLINYVDLQDEPLPGSVRAAVGAKAAAGVADADVDTATGSKPLVWLGSAAGVLVLVLAVLFLVFSGPQFLSLLGRAVVPFKPAEIATATAIVIDEPQGGDVTLTDGQPLTIAVHLDGRVPDPNGPEKPRLLVRYNPDSPDTVELPLTSAGSSREFRTDLGRGTILNGFLYRVAAGDARTAEHRVTVRTRAALGEFQAVYQFPAYLKWPNAQGQGAELKAVRGTVVTLTAKANRPLDSARLTTATVDGLREVVRGEVFGEGRDRVRFQLKLTADGTYRIDFKPTGPEVSTATADYPIKVDPDFAPEVKITKPQEDEVTLPLNGQLEVNGSVRDDHGIAGVELRFKLEGNDALAIKPKAYLDGKPLLREKDGTLLTDLTGENGAPMYKDSVRLDQLTDAKGGPVTLKEGDVLLYWLAAFDNCTEPKANEAESTPKKRVKLVAAPKEPEKQQQQQNKAQERKQEEKANQDKTDDKLKNETRPEEQSRDPERRDQPPPEQKPDPMQGDKQDGQPKGDKQEGQPQGDKQDGKQEGQPQGQKNGDKNEGQPQGDKQDGKQEGSGDGTPSDKEQQQKVEELKKKIEERKRQEKQEAGDARSDGDQSQGEPTKPEAGTKPSDAQPNGDGAKGSAEPKEGPKPDGANKPEGQPGQGKDSGHLTEPEKANDKPAPDAGAKGEKNPTNDQPKPAPKDGTDPGSAKGSKEQPADTKPEGRKPGEENKRDGSAGDARGAEPPAEKNATPQGDPMSGEQPKSDDRKTDPKELGGSKPSGSPQRGQSKESKADKPDTEKNAGGAKGERPDQPAGSKDASKGGEKDPMSKKGPPDAGQPKEGPKETGDSKDAAAAKGEGQQPEKPMPGQPEKRDDRGAAKPSDAGQPKGEKPADDKNPMQNGGAGKPDDKNPTGDQQPDQKDPKQGSGKGEKLDPKEMEKAVKDLESKDEKTKQAAQEKLDKAIGKENREKVEQMQKDLKSDDPAKREAAKQKLEDMAKDAQKNAGGQNQKPKELTEQEKKDLADAAKNLDSKDPQAKKDAQEKLDKAIGKENREKVEQMQKDLKSDDKATREAAEKQVQEMAKNAQQKGQQPPEPTEQQKKDLADAAKKLNSKDDAERKAAEQKLDDAIGKQNRQELQQDLKDLQGDDPAKAEQARKKLEQKLDDARNANKDKDDRQYRPGGAKPEDRTKAIDGNLENQLKSRELALDDFKKYRGNKEFLKESNLTEEQYERFLKQEESAVQKLRDQVAERRVNPNAGPTAPPTIRNDSGKVETRGQADKLNNTGANGKPPPGFEGAVQRFNQEASKQQK
ncbi:MAG: hypothetical protein MUF18_16015 [Fimbriiglobus sp.]|nr:hypothetical protein [Fimbriiglobus sp.]